MEFSSSRNIKLTDAQRAIPTRDGKLYAELFRHGTLAVEIYAPKGTDLQQPHTRDELYIVAAGRGWFLVEGKRVQFGPGDALFAAAGEVHRFEDLPAAARNYVAAIEALAGVPVTFCSVGPERDQTVVMPAAA